LKSDRKILDMNAFDAGLGEIPQRTARRLNNLGSASVLFYREPIEVTKAAGAWLHAADGTRYLDFYNNVPSVGHSHPAVVAAVSEQLATNNINSRYLVEIVDRYIEALKALLPDDLGNVVLTCTGSEANDLALRMAHRWTGATGVIVTECAYHGNTGLTTEISPSALRRSDPPDHVVVVAPPDRRVYGDNVVEGFAKAVSEAATTLRERGHGLSCMVADSIFSSDGVFSNPPGLLRPVVEAVHAAGGLFIADEVQPGFARTGRSFWGYARHGITPDMVTMGKPMGNGYPMAGVAARSEYVSAFCAEVGYFNTFGCTPAAAAAGLAVLDVIEREGLVENATTVGAHLLDRLTDIAEDAAMVGEVRGAGMFLGVDICGPDGAPDADATVATIDRLRASGVLVGAAGPRGATIKMRPALSLSQDEAEIFLAAFRKAVES